ncbi:MAG: CDP-glycerol glycerophosphotransferase family protein [Gemmatimonadaceae bacterium]|nr:CDP-glycerol glycerophosphotransferase family protein [Gemmatimonadaceae bacterium]
MRALQRSADLVQAWGDAPVGGRPTLRELFASEDVRIWDILAADLAMYRIPQALGHRLPTRRWSRPRRQLRAVNYALRHAARRCDDSDCARWPAGPVALFLGFTPYIARDILLPVVAAMADSHDLRPVVLTEDVAAPAESGGATFHSVWRHSADTQRDARRIARCTRKGFETLASDAAYRALFSDQGRSFWTDVSESVLDLGMYARDEIAKFSASARHVLSHHRPAVIVSPDVADARTRAFTSLGTAAGIPTIEVQFGACGPEATEWRFFAADRAAVWGPQSRDVLISHHVPAERVVVTGSPRHDVLFGVTDAERKAFRERFCVPAGNVAVVLGSTLASDKNPDAPVLRAMTQAIFAGAAAVPALTLVVKPHPLEDVNKTRQLASGAANIVFAAGAEDIRTVTRTCDAFVTLGSASTLDAVILGKPTICPAFPGWRWNELFVNTGAIAVPQTADEVASAFRELAQDGGASILARHAIARDTFLSEWVQEGGRGATNRVVTLLKGAALQARFQL